MAIMASRLRKSCMVDGSRGVLLLAVGCSWGWRVKKWRALLNNGLLPVPLVAEQQGVRRGV